MQLQNEQMLMRCKKMQKIICLQIYKDVPKRIKMQMFMICQDDCEAILDKKNEFFTNELNKIK